VQATSEQIVARSITCRPTHATSGRWTKTADDPAVRCQPPGREALPVSAAGKRAEHERQRQQALDSLGNQLRAELRAEVGQLEIAQLSFDVGLGSSPRRAPFRACLVDLRAAGDVQSCRRHAPGVVDPAKAATLRTSSRVTAPKHGLPDDLVDDRVAPLEGLRDRLGNPTRMPCRPSLQARLRRNASTAPNAT
jgi:hypothetical protein